MFLRNFVQYGLFGTQFGRSIFDRLRGQFVRLERAYQLYNLRVRPTSVRYGPFQGLIYSEEESSPWERVRLIGSYESYLHETIYSLTGGKEPAYDQVIVIGCAEGYYANGIAKLLPSVPILAIDIDGDVLDKARKMAVANNIEDQVFFSQRNSIDHLLELDGNSRALIICDCEGCEFSIFDESVLPYLENSDLIIEMHYSARSIINSIEGDRQPISPDVEFSTKFIESHDIQRIYHKEVDVRDYCLGNLPARTISEFVFETRDESAEWLVLRSKLARQS